jgi:hypothetical protein
MNHWPTLTPTLSPRRGSAEFVFLNSTRVAAINGQTDAKIGIFSTAVPVALPLLGERAGVRADVFPYTDFLP